MVKVKVANPGPLGLWVVNPSGSTKKMATKRRSRKRSTARRPNVTAAPRRRKRTTRRSNPTVFASSRRRTTPRRRSVSRRRNPSTGGLLSQAAGLAAGITVVGLAQGVIPPIGGVSPIMVAARQAATGYLIGEGMQRFGVMRAYSSEFKLAGFALGAGTLINAYVLPIVTGFLRPAPQQQQQQANQGGMADLVTLPAGNYDPYYGSTPKIGGAPVRVNKSAALKDLLAMPAMPGAYQRFGR